jgi:hypothetical protein
MEKDILFDPLFFSPLWNLTKRRKKKRNFFFLSSLLYVYIDNTLENHIQPWLARKFCRGDVQFGAWTLVSGRMKRAVGLSAKRQEEEEEEEKPFVDVYNLLSL